MQHTRQLGDTQGDDYAGAVQLALPAVEMSTARLLDMPKASFVTQNMIWC